MMKQPYIRVLKHDNQIEVNIYLNDEQLKSLIDRFDTLDLKGGQFQLNTKHVTLIFQKVKKGKNGETILAGSGKYKIRPFVEMGVILFLIGMGILYIIHLLQQI
jgi:hypothetical protein